MDYPIYFTLPELLHSATALKNKIENHPSFEEVNNLRKLGLMLDRIREKWGSAIVVSSGYRIEKLNTLLKGSKTSQHRYGQAADIEAKNGKNKALFNVIVDMIKSGEIEVGQLIDEYNYDWIHISLPTDKHHNEIKHIK